MSKLSLNEEENFYFHSKNNQQLKYSLTTRKIEHIVLAAFGLTNKNIAEVLCITESTVKKTFEDIFFKLKANDRASMVNIAWITGILSLDIEMQIFDKYCTFYWVNI